MPVFPGDPEVRIEAASSIETGGAANVSKISCGAHTGTHIDAPAHFIKDGRKIADIDLDALIGAARVVEIPGGVNEIVAHHVAPDALRGATRVLFKTRNSSFWQDSPRTFREDFTFVSPEAARSLVEQNVRLVGIDYLSVERFGSKDFETHLTLLGSEVVIVEGLNLSEVSAGEYELFCLPLRLADGPGDGVMARAVLRTIN
jgi:arylformamidase